MRDFKKSKSGHCGEDVEIDIDEQQSLLLKEGRTCEKYNPATFKWT